MQHTAMSRWYRAASAEAAPLNALATWREANGYVDAAASLREGIEETLTMLEAGAAGGAAPVVRNNERHREP